MNRMRDAVATVVKRTKAYMFWKETGDRRLQTATRGERGRR
jgi:hypothetical protein